MTARPRSTYVCQRCGYESPKWLGRCPGCSEWNSFVEEAQRPAAGPRSAWVPAGGGAVSLSEVSVDDVPRLPSGLGELDRVLGGGIVAGSLLLFGGDPGIGKSTLLLQVAWQLAARGRTALYVSGEESQRQVRMRADRIAPPPPSLLVAAQQDVNEIISLALQLRPALVVIDSIQTIYTPALESAPGGVGQVRECTAALLRFAKETGVAFALIGHVNKDGVLAGPRVLEHMVDAVLYFEGERHNSYRILRGVKNRFGAVSEIGLFEMTGAGLREVPNPSQALLAERPENVAGSVVVCSMEGTRPLLAEVQALVGPAALGVPRRTTAGVDGSRVGLVMAVLEKRCGLHLSGHDAYVKITGGIHLEEPAVDLGLAVALASSYREMPADPLAMVVGEVGLAGEIRSVTRLEQRLHEAARLGFRRAIVPVPPAAGKRSEPAADIEVVGVRTLHDALDAALLPG